MAIYRKFRRLHSDTNYSTPLPSTRDCDKVQSGLAVTPSQMMEMTNAGVSISSAGLNYFEGTENPSFDLPLDQRRGIDAADVWNAEKDAKKRLYQGNKNDVAMYGDN